MGFPGYGPSKGFGGKGKSGPYGFGKGKGKGKPAEEKPMVNPNQINPGKEKFDGGISFKNIFQEKLSKQIHRPMGPGDLVYTCTRRKGGRSCVLTLPCMGPDQAPFECDGMGKDDKIAGQMAAAKALEALFPEVYAAVLEAYGNIEAGAVAAVDPGGEPKGLLNRQVQVAAGRPLAAGDLAYATSWVHELKSYICTLKVNALEGGAELHTYESDISEGVFTDPKQAEKAAARACLDANEEVFAAAAAVHESKKQMDPKKNQGKGKNFGKSFGKGFGKSFGKY